MRLLRSSTAHASRSSWHALLMNTEFATRLAKPSLFLEQSSGVSVKCHADEPMACGTREAVQKFSKDVCEHLNSKVTSSISGHEPHPYLGARYWRVVKPVVAASKGGRAPHRRHPPCSFFHGAGLASCPGVTTAGICSTEDISDDEPILGADRRHIQRAVWQSPVHSAGNECHHVNA